MNKLNDLFVLNTSAIVHDTAIFHVVTGIGEENHHEACNCNEITNNFASNSRPVSTILLY